MVLSNKTKKIALTKRVKHCRTVFSKAKGLMFSKKKHDTALIFHFEQPTKVSLHMFFVFYTIDVLFLDEQKKVIEIKKAFKPFTVYYPKKKASYLVELIDLKTTEIGDYLSF